MGVNFQHYQNQINKLKQVNEQLVQRNKKFTKYISDNKLSFTEGTGELGPVSEGQAEKDASQAQKQQQQQKGGASPNNLIQEMKWINKLKAAENEIQSLKFKLETYQTQVVSAVAEKAKEVQKAEKEELQKVFTEEKTEMKEEIDHLRQATSSLEAQTEQLQSENTKITTELTELRSNLDSQLQFVEQMQEEFQRL